MGSKRLKPRLQLGEEIAHTVYETGYGSNTCREMVKRGLGVRGKEKPLT
jgi:hypothetical protein